MRQSIFAVALLSAFTLPAAAQVLTLPILTPGGPIAAITAPIFAAFPAPLTTTAPLPADVSVLENGADGSGINQVLGLGGNNATSSLIGNQLNNTLVTPLLGLPRGTAQPIDVAVLGGDGVGNSNLDGLAGVAVLSGSNVAHGGLVGLGLLNRDNTGSGQLLGVAALSGSNSGNSSEGLGIGLLNRGEALGVSYAGARVVTLGSLASQAQGALPGLDQGGLAIAGGQPVTSSNPLLNAGLLAGDNAGNAGLLGVAALSGNNAANAQLIGVGLLNQSGSGKGALGVDVLSGNGSGVSSNGAGIAVLSGDHSGAGSAIGAGVLTGSSSGTGGMLGAGVLSGDKSGQSAMAGVAALSGAGSGAGGTLGGNVAGATTGNSGGVVTPGTDDGSLGNGAAAGGSGAGSAFVYNGGDSGITKSARAQDVCKLGYKDASGRLIRAEQCDPKLAPKG